MKIAIFEKCSMSNGLKDSKIWAMMMSSGSWFHIPMVDGKMIPYIFGFC
jgi:hypothetical protein